MAASYCPHCGTPLERGNAFCTHCGQRTEKPVEPIESADVLSTDSPKELSAWIWVLLAIVLVGGLLFLLLRPAPSGHKMAEPTSEEKERIVSDIALDNIRPEAVSGPDAPLIPHDRSSDTKTGRPLIDEGR